MKQLLLFVFLCCCASSYAQTKFLGSWQGAINVGKELHLGFNIKAESNGTYSATMDSPDQGVTGIPCSGVAIHGDSITIEMAKLKAAYNGVLDDISNISGSWTQSGTSIMLNLKRIGKPVELIRPQTPKPPFAYISEDTTYQDAYKIITYGATITIPKGKGPFPAVVLITGSGAQNRDEELFGHKPFAVIADYLTRHGYIVLRVDDRGVGKTTGERKMATSVDFADDVIAAVEYLHTRKEVDLKKIGLMGHSEGGMIAPMVARQRKDISFIILMAGPGVKIAQLMEEQNTALFEKAGMSKATTDRYALLYRNIIKQINKSKDSTEARTRINDAVEDWKINTSEEIITTTTGIKDEKTQRTFVDGFMEIYNNSWFKYFLSYDPQPNLQKLTCKVLALNGEKDMQVIAKSNLAGIRSALEKSKSKAFETHELPGLNHLFQHCQLCTVSEYGQLEETISTDALKMVTDWLDKNIQ
jgi:pimeloyl-ACP methyl ester carboxylesterase